MTILNNVRKAAAFAGIEAVRANAMTTWRCRLPALLARHGFTCVLDVGANDGGFASELLANGYDGTILSFEPLLGPWQALRTRAQRYAGRWQVVPPIALSDREAEAEFYEAGNTVSSSLLRMADRHLAAAPHSATVAARTVRTARLDDVIDGLVEPEHEAIYLKLDVQGAERLVLDGAAASLAGRIRGVQLEMSLTRLYEGQALANELDAILRAAGFILWDMVPGFRDAENLQLLQYDGVYLRSDA